MSERHVLLVCTANQCRSPMAEALIRARAAENGEHETVIVRSAGTWATCGACASAHAVAVMSERGLDLQQHRAQEIDTDLVAWSDVILVMAAGHREAIEREFPSSAGKVRLMSSLAGGSWDVVDPVGGTLEDYRATAEELARLVDAGWRLIVTASD